MSATGRSRRTSSTVDQFNDTQVNELISGLKQILNYIAIVIRANGEGIHTSDVVNSTNHRKNHENVKRNVTEVSKSNVTVEPVASTSNQLQDRGIDNLESGVRNAEAEPVAGSSGDGGRVDNLKRRGDSVDDVAKRSRVEDVCNACSVTFRGDILDHYKEYHPLLYSCSKGIETPNPGEAVKGQNNESGSCDRNSTADVTNNHNTLGSVKDGTIGRVASPVPSSVLPETAEELNKDEEFKEITNYISSLDPSATNVEMKTEIEGNEDDLSESTVTTFKSELDVEADVKKEDSYNSDNGNVKMENVDYTEIKPETQTDNGLNESISNELDGTSEAATGEIVKTEVMKEEIDVEEVPLDEVVEMGDVRVKEEVDEASVLMQLALLKEFEENRLRELKAVDLERKPNEIVQTAFVSGSRNPDVESTQPLELSQHQKSNVSSAKSVIKVKSDDQLYEAVGTADVNDKPQNDLTTVVLSDDDVQFVKKERQLKRNNAAKLNRGMTAGLLRSNSGLSGNLKSLSVLPKILPITPLKPLTFDVDLKKHTTKVQRGPGNLLPTPGPSSSLIPEVNSPTNMKYSEEHKRLELLKQVLEDVNKKYP